MRITSVFLVCQLLSGVFAVYLKAPRGTLIGYGCGNSVQATLCRPRARGFTFCPCVDVNALGSFIYCGYENASNDRERRQVQRYLRNACPTITPEMMDRAYDNVTNYLVNTSTIPNFNRSKYVNFPVYFNRTQFNIAYESQKHYRDNMFNSLAWGSGLLGFWAVLLVLGGIDHWGSRMFPRFSLRLKRAVSQLRPLRWWRKNVTLPALLNGRHTAEGRFGGFIPTRFEAIVMFVFFVLAIFAETLNLHIYRRSIIWRINRIQLTRFIGDRSGIVSAFLMLPTYLFAGRNNFFLWVTGWKQSTFLTFHKWLARITMLTVIVHSLVFAINSGWLGLYSYRISTNWWRLGAVASVAGSVMLVQSLGIFRAYSYEIFLYVHISMAILFLAGSWIHMVYWDYGAWTYACAAIWCFDRFTRIARIAKFGIKTAEVNLISDDILVLTMPHGFRLQKPLPGSFGYVYFLKSWLWFQSHPFTVIEDDNGKQKFLIKIKKGVTKRLHDKLLQEPSHTLQIKVAVEGFYGEYKQAYAYDEVLMISGGNGIPGIYEYVADIAKHKKAGRSKTKYVKFYWVIRHWDSLDWFLEELKQLQQYDFVETIVYVTKYHELKIDNKFAQTTSTLVSTKSSTESVTESNSDKNQLKVSEDSTNELHAIDRTERIFKELPHVEFRDSRPNIAQVVRDDIKGADDNHDIAVLSCAHNIMCDEVRRAVSYEAGVPRAGRIDLFELLQLW